MESAIPDHLRCPRTHARRGAAGFVPPFGSPVARFAPGLRQVVMAYFGTQHPDADAAAPRAARARLDLALQQPDGAAHIDRAAYVDEMGCSTQITIAYWADPAAFDRWFDAHGRHWTRGPDDPGCGTFVEVVRPSVERFETLFSSLSPEGVAKLACGFSGDVQEHGYWGGARDRLAAAQTDALASGGAPRLVSEGMLQRVMPHDNLCLIRSGQDWSETEGDERRMYLEEIEPVLRAGMDFLRDDGAEVGCFASRYVRRLDTNGQPIEKSFGMSLWTDLSALERWSRSHRTHLAIFGVAMKYLEAMGTGGKLRLHHEVSVVRAADQLYEYARCHARTGLLRAMR